MLTSGNFKVNKKIQKFQTFSQSIWTQSTFLYKICSYIPFRTVGHEQNYRDVKSQWFGKINYTFIWKTYNANNIAGWSENNTLRIFVMKTETVYFLWWFGKANSKLVRKGTSESFSSLVHVFLMWTFDVRL